MMVIVVVFCGPPRDGQRSTNAGRREKDCRRKHSPAHSGSKFTLGTGAVWAQCVGRSRLHTCDAGPAPAVLLPAAVQCPMYSLGGAPAPSNSAAALATGIASTGTALPATPSSNRSHTGALKYRLSRGRCVGCGRARREVLTSPTYAWKVWGARCSAGPHFTAAAPTLGR